MDKNELGMDRLLQDLWWRQRNIVFPDTVRNEGVFYRNLARGEQSRDALQRVGMMMAAVIFLFGGCMYLALALGAMAAEGLAALIPAIIMFAVAGVFFAVGGKLVIAAVFNIKRRGTNPQIVRRRHISGRR
jgi:hypothetical protein